MLQTPCINIEPGAPFGGRLYNCSMETPAEIRQRWSYLRDLLIEQLGRFESGTYKILADNVDVSAEAVGKLKQEILDFDRLIASSESRDPSHPRP